MSASTLQRGGDRGSRSSDVANSGPLRESESLSRVTRLDGLRGFAFLAVFMVHVRLPAGFSESHPWLEKMKEVGWIGVPMFFVLSGYLITELALQEGAAFSLRRFGARRALRLWPLYFTAVVLGLLAWQAPQLREFKLAAAPHWALSFCTFTMNMALSGNSAAVGTVGALIPLWTVCVEMQFYFAWAMALRYTPRRFVLVLCFAILFVSLLARLIVPLDRYFLFYRMHTLVSCAPLMLGAALALFNVKRWKFGEAASHAGLAASVVVALIIAYFEWPFPTRTWTGALLLGIADALCLALLLLTLCGSGVVKTVCESGPLRMVGTLSYAGYVFHLPILWGYYAIKESLLAGNPWHLPPTIWIAVDAAVCLIVTLLCAMSWHKIERPFRRARARLHVAESIVS